MTKIKTTIKTFTEEQLKSSIGVEKFYEVLGINFKDTEVWGPVMENAMTSSEKCKNSDVKNMFMNKKMCEALLDYAKANYKKHPRLKKLYEKAAHNALAHEWLGYSPTTDESVPDYELHIRVPVETKGKGRKKK